MKPGKCCRCNKKIEILDFIDDMSAKMVICPDCQTDEDWEDF